MDVGIPFSLLTTFDGVTSAEIIFNDLSGNAVPSSLAGLGGTIWPGPNVAPEFPSGLPEGNGYLMQYSTGMRGSPVRNPVDIRPHKHGGIVHQFFHGPRYFTMTGLVVATKNAYRTVLYDYLDAYVYATLQKDARLFVKPVGRSTRFLTCRNYDTAEIQGPSGQPGASPGGIAAPKQFVVPMVAAYPRWLTYTERDYTIALGASTPVANAGTAEAWPVLRVHGPFTAFTVSNGVFQLEWFSNTPIASGHFIEINMYNETLYLDGNSSNELGGVIDAPSDFWSIPVGGCTISFVGTSTGAPTCDVLTNDTWV